MNAVKLDVTVFGGGIAGLWTLARLHQQGYRAVLFETQAFGGGQSIASQGIIHGGSKYSLTGKQQAASQALRDMPRYWRACLAGTGQLDLRDVRQMAQHQHLWTTPQLFANLSGRIARHLMHSQMHSLDNTAYPAPYKHPDFRGQLYQLDEPVLDTQSLISTLATKTQTHSYLLNSTTPKIQRKNNHWQINLSNGQQIHSRALVLTAGAGNAALLEHLGRSTPQMQRRPLHMLMLQGKLPAIYAHHLTGGTTPALTITSSPQPDNTQTWYIGGTIAEQGTQRHSTDQIQAGHQALAKALPWIERQHTRWASLPIERAEPKTTHGQRPNDSYLHQAEGIFTAWPTKLTLAPRLAEQILTQLPPPAGYPAPATLQLPHPPLAQPPWHTQIQWKTAH